MFSPAGSEVDPHAIGVIGGSRGGEAALLLGASFPQLAAIVAEVPSGVAWGAPRADGSETSSWTRGGVPVGVHS